jgi:hypothetical protein
MKLELTGSNLLYMPCCPKPKWMRWRTPAWLAGVIRERHAHQAADMVRR